MASIADREGARRTVAALSIRLERTRRELQRAIVEAQTLIQHDARELVDPTHAIDGSVVRTLASMSEVAGSIGTRTRHLAERESRARLRNVFDEVVAG